MDDDDVDSFVALTRLFSIERAKFSTDGRQVTAFLCTKSKEDYGETFDPFITRFPLPIYEEPEKKREMIRLLGSNPGQHQRTAWPTKRKRKGEPPFFLFCFYQSYGRFGARYEAIDGGNSFVSS